VPVFTLEKEGSFEAEQAGEPKVLVTRVGDAEGSRAAAAALACAAAEPDRASLLVDFHEGRAPRPTLVASAAARQLEERLAVHLSEAGVASRGQVCHMTLSPDSTGIEAARAATTVARGSVSVLHLPPRLLQDALEDDGLRPSGALLRADLDRDRALTALAVGDLHEKGLRAAVLKRPLGWIAARRALAGAIPANSGGGLPARLCARMLEERGQALPLALGGAFVLILAALALVSIAGAITGKGRVQRAADLAAISAARSMRDDLPRLLSPPTLPNGLPNPLHLEKPTYLMRARMAASQAARANGVAPARLRVSFPDGISFAPVRAKVSVLADVDVGKGRVRTEATAIAEAAAPMSAGGMPTMASGGGYSGPLTYRQGEGMRPDVGAAFDRMAAAASQAGISLVINSGFRSDAEQAALFAANPDPQWVAPPGQSLHRCATELDLGPDSAYGWLAANASRFGFAQRYSWEAWHYGYTQGPPPCSQAGNAVGTGGGDGATAGAGGLPAFVPARYREPLLRAAARWNVSAALLAAQLMAESNFNPYASSLAGAQGIAQFIPSTAAAYGLDNPFDPEAAIDAQAHLMSDLIRQLGSPTLALAGYNAGPAPVEACSCIPAYPETQAYVTRILALLGGAGTLALPAFEVRLIE
jgi:transglycosylase-like protein with SLT domain/D-alanyl-D-alanine carboxypeptidase-like protein/putative Flp pilus-assembly TadE/G-like protein